MADPLTDYDPFAWDWELPWLTADPFADVYEPPPPILIPPPPPPAPPPVFYVPDPIYFPPVVAIPDPIIETYEAPAIPPPLPPSVTTSPLDPVAPTPISVYDPFAWDWELPWITPPPPPVVAFPDPIIDTYEPPVVAIPDPIIETYEEPPAIPPPRPPIVTTSPLDPVPDTEVNPMEALMMNANTGERRSVGNVTDALNLLKTKNWSIYNPVTMREIIIALAPMAGTYPNLYYDVARWDIDNMIVVDSGTPSAANGYLGDRMTLRDYWDRLTNPAPPPPPILVFPGMPPPPPIEPYVPRQFPVRVVVEGKGRLVYNEQELSDALFVGGYIDSAPIESDPTPPPYVPPNTPVVPTPGAPDPLWFQIIQQTDQAYANGRLTTTMLQTALNLLRGIPPPVPAVVGEKIGAWQFTIDNNLLGDAVPPPNPNGPAEPDWLLVIRNMDAANAEGRLTSAMLRTGIATLKQTPPPVPDVVTQKIADWQYTIDNNLLGDIPQGPGPDSPLPPYPAPTSSSPSLVTVGLIGLAAFFLLKK